MSIGPIIIRAALASFRGPRSLVPSISGPFEAISQLYLAELKSAYSQIIQILDLHSEPLFATAHSSIPYFHYPAFHSSHLPSSSHHSINPC